MASRGERGGGGTKIPVRGGKMQQTAAAAALFLGLGVDGGGDDLAGGEVELRRECGEVCLEGGEVADAGVVDEVVCCVCGERHLPSLVFLSFLLGGVFVGSRYYDFEC